MNDPPTRDQRAIETSGTEDGTPFEEADADFEQAGLKVSSALRMQRVVTASTAAQTTK